MMAEILATKPGVLTVADKKLLRASGVVVVEANDPSQIRLLSTERGELSGSDMLYAALCGVQQSDFAKIGFAEACMKLLDAQRTAGAA